MAFNLTLGSGCDWSLRRPKTDRNFTIETERAQSELHVFVLLSHHISLIIQSLLITLHRLLCNFAYTFKPIDTYQTNISYPDRPCDSYPRAVEPFLKLAIYQDNDSVTGKRPCAHLCQDSMVRVLY